jgi:hypothetical protein
MRTIDDTAELERLYEAPVATSLTKVSPRITPLYRRWIGTARFCILSSVGPEGTDASPRGEDGPVVRIVDERTLWLPDWRGNNRLDSLRNIVRDGRVSLLFMVPGSGNVVRVNGTAVLTDDAGLVRAFERNGRHPRTVIVISVAEIYFQCAKAMMRAALWSRNDAAAVPTAGQFLREQDGGFDADGYDASYEANARPRMW